MIYVGIDPDTVKSGVAIWDNKKRELSLCSLSFFEIYDFLSDLCPDKVIIDAGWLNKSNWHTNSKLSVAVNSAIAERTGANHETGKKLAEMCEHLDIPYVLHKPEKSKIKASEFKRITKYPGRTNQDVRDAAMLVYGL